MAPMTVDEAMAIVRKAREYGGPDHLLQYAVLADEVGSLRAEMARMRKRCDRWEAVANGWRDVADQRLKALDDMPAQEADQDARIASLKAEIGKWAVAYNELHERITTAQLALRRARFNPVETT